MDDEKFLRFVIWATLGTKEFKREYVADPEDIEIHEIIVTKYKDKEVKFLVITPDCNDIPFTKWVKENVSALLFYCTGWIGVISVKRILKTLGDNRLGNIKLFEIRDLIIKMANEIKESELPDDIKGEKE